MGVAWGCSCRSSGGICLGGDPVAPRLHLSALSPPRAAPCKILRSSTMAVGSHVGKGLSVKRSWSTMGHKGESARTQHHKCLAGCRVNGPKCKNIKNFTFGPALARLWPGFGRSQKEKHKELGLCSLSRWPHRWAKPQPWPRCWAKPQREKHKEIGFCILSQ